MAIFETKIKMQKIMTINESRPLRCQITRSMLYHLNQASCIKHVDWKAISSTMKVYNSSVLHSLGVYNLATGCHLWQCVDLHLLSMTASGRPQKLDKALWVLGDLLSPVLLPCHRLQSFAPRQYLMTPDHPSKPEDSQVLTGPTPFESVTTKHLDTKFHCISV